MTATLAIVVVNYASARLLERNLGSVGLEGLDVRVVVVDNFASPADTAAVRKLAGRAGWHLVTLPTTAGSGTR